MSSGLGKFVSNRYEKGKYNYQDDFVTLRYDTQVHKDQRQEKSQQYQQYQQRMVISKRKNSNQQIYEPRKEQLKKINEAQNYVEKEQSSQQIENQCNQSIYEQNMPLSQLSGSNKSQPFSESLSMIEKKTTSQKYSDLDMNEKLLGENLCQILKPNTQIILRVDEKRNIIDLKLDSLIIEMNDCQCRWVLKREPKNRNQFNLNKQNPDCLNCIRNIFEIDQYKIGEKQVTIGKCAFKCWNVSMMEFIGRCKRCSKILPKPKWEEILWVGGTSRCQKLCDQCSQPLQLSISLATGKIN